ncbi:hypothetical protein ACFL5Y_03320, partial [Candidatus Omnitrophota bacterium]
MKSRRRLPPPKAKVYKRTKGGKIKAAYDSEEAKKKNKPREEYTYHEKSGNLKTKVVYPIKDIESPYYSYNYEEFTYYDEDFYGNGTGRVKTKGVVKTPPNHWYDRYDYEYHEGTDKVRFKRVKKYTIPALGYYYDLSGNLIREVGPYGHGGAVYEYDAKNLRIAKYASEEAKKKKKPNEEYTYYGSGNLMTKRIYSYKKGQHHTETFTYYDEDFYGDGIGRVMEKMASVIPPKSTDTYYYEYHTGTDKVKTKVVKKYTVPPYRYDYDSSGNLIREYNIMLG